MTTVVDDARVSTVARQNTVRIPNRGLSCQRGE